MSSASHSAHDNTPIYVNGEKIANNRWFITIPTKSRSTAEMKKMLADFLQNTSVPGLSQFASRRNAAWKFSWMFLTLVGLAMAIYQSRNVITDYYQKSIVQRISYSSPLHLPLPSVTVCSNIFVDGPTLANISRTNKTLAKFLQWSRSVEGRYDDEPVPKYRRMYLALSRMMMKEHWNESRRLNLCGPLEQRLSFFALRPDENLSFQNPSHAIYNGLLVEFHNFAFGCCYTINPGFRKIGAILNGRKKELFIQLNMDLVNRMIQSNDFFMRLLIHPLGTPPLLASPDVMEVYPGDYLNINLKLLKIKRNLDSSKCVSNNDVKWRKSLALYKDKTPYIYTKEACEETCEQNILLKAMWPEQSCLQAEMPITENMLKLLDDRRPAAFCTDIMAKDLLSKINFSCNCPTACKEFILKKSVVSSSGLNWSTYKHMIRFNMSGIKAAKEIFGLEQYGSAVIRIIYETTQVESIIEENKYSEADFWGIIGGNLGLWVGLCLLSCVEIVEFFSSVVTALVKRFK